jgi:hypothetical protein
MAMVPELRTACVVTVPAFIVNPSATTVLDALKPEPLTVIA